MAIMTMQNLNRSIRKLGTHAVAFRQMVQESLVSAAFFAFRDGNVTPFNQIILAVGNGTHIKGITMWVEIAAGIGRVKDGAIVLNKKVRDQSGVIDEATFAEFEAEMCKINWWEVAGKQHAESVFDEGVYMKRVIKKLTDKGYSDLAETIKQAELGWLVKKSVSDSIAIAKAVETPADQPKAVTQ